MSELSLDSFHIKGPARQGCHILPLNERSRNSVCRQAVLTVSFLLPSPVPHQLCPFVHAVSWQLEAASCFPIPCPLLFTPVPPHMPDCQLRRASQLLLGMAIELSHPLLVQFVSRAGCPCAEMLPGGAHHMCASPEGLDPFAVEQGVLRPACCLA